MQKHDNLNHLAELNFDVLARMTQLCLWQRAEGGNGMLNLNLGIEGVAAIGEVLKVWRCRIARESVCVGEQLSHQSLSEQK